MAAFGYQHMTPFLLDPLALLQNMAKNLNFPSGGGLVMEVEEEGFLMNSHLDESSKKSLSVMMEVDEEGFLMNSHLDESSTKSLSVGDGEVNGPADQSSSVVNKLENGEQVPPMDMKRKNSSGSSLDSPKQKGGRERRSKRQKKGNGEVKEEENKGKPEKKDQKKIPDPPIGYIHVRARRGQATDSHSLAERVRREKISERMKILQHLVPGCDKVNGKALMLDEIINYVLSLQNQAEFLSTKLASFNPLFYEFGMYPDAFMVLPERPSIMESPSLSPMQQYSPTKTTTLVDANTTTATTSAVATAPAAATFVQAINYPLMDNSSLQLLQGQRPIDFTQDTASLLWDLEEQRQRFLNPSLVQQQLEYLPLI